MYLNEQRRSRIQMVYSYQEHRKESQVPDQKIEEHVSQIILNQLGPSESTCVSKRHVLATKHRCLVKRQDKKARGKVLLITVWHSCSKQYGGQRSYFHVTGNNNMNPQIWCAPTINMLLKRCVRTTALYICVFNILCHCNIFC